MDYKYIEQLLERYWNCETSLEEDVYKRQVLIQLRIQAVDFYLKADTAFFRIIFMPHRPFDRLDTGPWRTQYYRILSFRLRIEQITINTLVLLIQLKSDQVTVYFVRRIFLYVLFGISQREPCLLYTSRCV